MTHSKEEILERIITKEKVTPDRIVFEHINPSALAEVLAELSEGKDLPRGRQDEVMITKVGEIRAEVGGSGGSFGTSATPSLSEGKAEETTMLELCKYCLLEGKRCARHEAPDSLEEERKRVEKCARCGYGCIYAETSNESKCPCVCHKFADTAPGSLEEEFEEKFTQMGTGGSNSRLVGRPEDVLSFIREKIKEAGEGEDKEWRDRIEDAKWPATENDLKYSPNFKTGYNNALIDLLSDNTQGE